MPKQQKSVRSLSIYEPTIQRLGEFRVVHPLPEDPERLRELGFDGNPADGESIVPSQVGPISTFNANGREIVRKTCRRSRSPAWSGHRGTTGTEILIPACKFAHSRCIRRS